MPAYDVAMSIEEFRRYWAKNRRSIRSARAYDAAGRRWVEGEEIFRAGGAYTLIVVRLRDKSFLRIDVKPSLEVAYAPEKFASAGTWSRLGVHLTYEEKAFLESLGDAPLTPGELIATVASSDFPGREALAKKLRQAAESLRR